MRWRIVLCKNIWLPHHVHQTQTTSITQFYHRHTSGIPLRSCSYIYQRHTVDATWGQTTISRCFTVTSASSSYILDRNWCSGKRVRQYLKIRTLLALLAILSHDCQNVLCNKVVKRRPRLSIDIKSLPARRPEYGGLARNFHRENGPVTTSPKIEISYLYLY